MTESTDPDVLPDRDVVNRLELIADEVNVGDSVDSVMESIVGAVIKHTPWTLCWVAMIDTVAERILHDYHAGAYHPDYLFDFQNWDLSETISLHVARTGEVMAFEDVGAVPDFPYLKGAHDAAGIVSALYLSIPFEHESQSVVLNVNLPHAHVFSASEISLARGIATFAAIAFRNVLAKDRAIEAEAAEKVKLAELNAAILQKNASLERLSDAQGRLLRLQTEGADVPTLCAEVSELLGMPMLLLDPFYQQLGFAGFTADAADVLAELVARRRGGQSARHDPRPAMVVLDGRSVIITNVVEDNTLVATVVLEVADATTPSPTVMQVLELARVHVSLMVMRYRASFETEARFAREFIDALASGSSNLSITQHAGLLGVRLQSTSQVMLAQIGGLATAMSRRAFDELAQFIAARLRQSGVSLVAAPTGESDLMIVLTNVNPWGSERVTKILRRSVAEGTRLMDRTAEGITVAVGIGGGFSGIDGLRRSHYEASRALQITLTSGHIDGDLSFDDAGTYAVLASTPLEDRQLFVQRYLKPLLDYDRMHGGAFFTTLETYFEAIGNVPRTAERLFLHVSTVRYRLRRIEELAGISLEDEEDRLRLQLCLRFARLAEAASDALPSGGESPLSGPGQKRLRAVGDAHY
ncbi:helix-turn-helix domain-containing protein [Cnuibacter physcomitrellae]|uniref:helix-turn-helix domain-containing protein n=1 Tax=Cnuibacter physcomitrellae TaxID=1619308 RepID=UPI002175A158|nr:helix-turn-helix domain-containing protein [Cnuibacter physcomitrellae]MCS5498291.1 helix-turn-helix domain-containing protein [Cnuibacter physcomitrellae]